MSIKISTDRRNIRKYMRIMRNSLNFKIRYEESIKISKFTLKCSLFFNSKNIAIFLPFDGEINTYPLILNLWLNKKNVFLPVIQSFNKKKLIFVHFTPNSLLYYNKYKILEPFFKLKDIISIYDLNIVIVPLVAFDKIGTRLGMGGGFYDSFLQNWKKKILFQLVFLLIFN